MTVSKVRVVVRIRDEQLERKIKRCIKGGGSFVQFYCYIIQSDVMSFSIKVTLLGGHLFLKVNKIGLEYLVTSIIWSKILHTNQQCEMGEILQLFSEDNFVRFLRQKSV